MRSSALDLFMVPKRMLTADKLKCLVVYGDSPCTSYGNSNFVADCVYLMHDSLWDLHSSSVSLQTTLQIGRPTGGGGGVNYWQGQ
jgi:hypothetical protein